MISTGQIQRYLLYSFKIVQESDVSEVFKTKINQISQHFATFCPYITYIVWRDGVRDKGRDTDHDILYF